jgi:hypothetical protein
MDLAEASRMEKAASLPMRPSLSVAPSFGRFHPDGSSPALVPATTMSEGHL